MSVAVIILLKSPMKCRETEKESESLHRELFLIPGQMYPAAKGQSLDPSSLVPGPHCSVEDIAAKN